MPIITEINKAAKDNLIMYLSWIRDIKILKIKDDKYNHAYFADSELKYSGC